MKLKERTALRAHTVQELKAALHKTRLEHGKLRFRHQTAPIKNPLELRILRRHIARLESLIHLKSEAVAAPAKEGSR